MMQAQMAMALDMFAKRFTPDWQDETEAKAAYEKHNADVRASVPADRLIDYRVGDGWEPICEKLGLAGSERAVPAPEHDRRVPRHDRHGTAHARTCTHVLVPEPSPFTWPRRPRRSGTW